jgi:hypothetical protein
MWILAFLLSVLLSIFSTAVMSYIAMATPIGPWIASTLVLIAMLVFKIFRKQDASEHIALVTASGSVGGIVATALGFSFPTLYFLDPVLFNSWMAHPFYFISVVAGLSLAAGWFGFWIANMIEHKFIVEDQLAFPIGQLTYKMIAAQQQVRKAWELVIGFIATAVFCIVQDGIFAFKGLLPKTVALMQPTAISIFRLPLLPFDLWPLLWAIGFVTGHVIAVPLAIGALTKILIVEPINHGLFNTVKSMEFILAFASGMVLAGALQSLIDMPSMVWKVVQKIKGPKEGNVSAHSMIARLSWGTMLEAVGVFIAIIVFLTYFKFPFISQIYLILFTFICTYQIALIAGQIGLAPLGRFATFVMVPAMLLFNLNFIQIVFIATFVEVCGGVAADILFGRKMGHMGALSINKMKAYQYLGLVVSAITAGIVFWLLINHFQLGSVDLFAQKAQSRQLLIDVKSFDAWILLIGMAYGIILKYININPMLVLGGLLMPLNISIGLMIGGFATKLTKDKEAWYPFWSGVFASNSIWMLLKAVL